MITLEARNLTVKSHQGKILIDNLNFFLDSSQRLGLIGESGSGKSLTALSILGLLPSSLEVSGQLLLTTENRANLDIISSSESVLNSIRGSVAGIIFQEPGLALNPTMRVKKQLQLAFLKHRTANKADISAEVLGSLAEVHISNPKRVSESYPHQISGGEKQRVAIALALACQPKLLIADEPTTSLDVSVQAGIIDLLDELVDQRRMSLIFISHDLAVVGQLVKRVLVMQNGIGIEEASLDKLLSSPSHEYVRELVESARRLDNFLDQGRDRNETRLV